MKYIFQLYLETQGSRQHLLGDLAPVTQSLDLRSKNQPTFHGTPPELFAYSGGSPQIWTEGHLRVKKLKIDFTVQL